MNSQCINDDGRGGVVQTPLLAPFVMQTRYSAVHVTARCATIGNLRLRRRSTRALLAWNTTPKLVALCVYVTLSAKLFQLLRTQGDLLLVYTKTAGTTTTIFVYITNRNLNNTVSLINSFSVLDLNKIGYY